MPNFLLIQEMNNSKIKRKIKIRDMTNFVTKDFQATIEIENIMDSSDTQDTDDMLNIFQTKLLKAIAKHAPFKTLSHKKIKMRKKPTNKNINTSKNKRKE